jgi:hypothetical protein
MRKEPPGMNAISSGSPPQLVEPSIITSTAAKRNLIHSSGQSYALVKSCFQNDETNGSRLLPLTKAIFIRVSSTYMTRES